MLDERIHQALNKQLNRELYSAYLYFAMSAYCKSKNLEGFATYLQKQGVEEIAHAQKFYDYIHDRNARVLLQPLEGPPIDWPSVVTLFEEAHKHEQAITGHIYNLVALSAETKDYATSAFLQWFVTEQVEEENKIDVILQKLKMVGDAQVGIYMIDRSLAQ